MSFVYTPAKTKLAKGDLDLETGDIRVKLLMSNTTADTEQDAASLSAITTLDEYNGAGYSELDLGAGTAASDTANDRSEADYSDGTFGALSPGSRNWVGLLFYCRVDGTAANDFPIAFEDIGANNGNGGVLTLEVGDEGLFWLTDPFTGLADDPPPVGAKFVDLTLGNNANAGTFAAPWQTLAHAVSTATANSVIVFRGSGVEGSPVNYGGGFNSKNLTFENYQHEHVEFRDTSRNQTIAWQGLTAGGMRVRGTGTILLGQSAASVLSDFSQGQAALQLAGCTNLTFDGMSAIGGTGYGLKICSLADFGVNTTNNGATWTNEVTFKGCDIFGNGVGVFIRGGGTNTVAPTNGRVTVEYSKVHDNNRMLHRSEGGNNDSGALGIGLYKCSGAIVRHNDIYNNWATVAVNGNPPSPDYGSDGGAVEYYGAINSLVEWNRIWDNDGILEMGTDTSSPIPTNNVFQYNICWGNTDPYGASGGIGILARAFTNSVIRHNVFDIDAGSWIIVIDPSTTGYGAGVNGGTMVNNIIISRSAAQSCVLIQGTLPGNFTLNYNLYRNTASGTKVFEYHGYGSFTTTGSLATFRSDTPFEDNGYLSDPLFTDRVNRDYTVGAASDAVDAGLVIAGVNDDFAGSGPDIGVFDQ